MDKVCDLCNAALQAFHVRRPWIDGKLKAGPWATMCVPCHRENGIGFGLGKGQMFDKDGQKVKG